MITGDTICAVSSAVGAGARMIVRVSGEGALGIAERLGGGMERGARRSRLKFGGLEAPAWIYVFHGPASYTGEHLVEFHLPGNPVLARMMLEELHRLGARPAEAGEFTARAYFNGRMGLTEAEGVAAAVAATGEQELAAARQLMSGELARRLGPAVERLADTLALVEAGIDFSDEEVSFIEMAEVAKRCAEVEGMLGRLIVESVRFEKLAHEPVFVLVGRANAGKSTLLNALAGAQRAVVSPVAGTTRDALSAEVALRRGLVRVVDVAGLEDEPRDEIEQKMRQRALEMVEAADVVVLVREALDDRPVLTLGRAAQLEVRTKADLSEGAPEGGGAYWVSAQMGAGMERLREGMSAVAFGEAAGGGALALNARHRRAIEEARESLVRAGSSGGGGAEVVALGLREALDALGSVIGQVTPDDVLGRIFSTFCIGK
jgi:tRNA modification GTPase